MSNASSQPTELDRTLTALSDPTRRAVIELLRQEPRRAGDLAKQLAVPPAGLSRHLRILRSSGLVEEDISRDDARVRVYHLRREPFDGLDAWVQEVRSFWDGQLSAFKAHVEGRARRKTPRGGRQG